MSDAGGELSKFRQALLVRDAHRSIKVANDLDNHRLPAAFRRNGCGELSSARAAPGKAGSLAMWQERWRKALKATPPAL